VTVLTKKGQWRTLNWFERALATVRRKIIMLIFEKNSSGFGLYSHGQKILTMKINPQ